MRMSRQFTQPSSFFTYLSGDASFARIRKESSCHNSLPQSHCICQNLIICPTVNKMNCQV
uniref:Uncharacterized protein n=1 Tax=Arundo donax TaxID=35708 RepID=A0A0A9DTL5_ARUDO